MTEYLIQIHFANVDIDDDRATEVLAEAGAIGAEPTESGGVLVHAAVTDRSAISAATRFISDVTDGLPDAVPLRVDRDLVSVTDIAERIGLTREAVRNWSKGKRRTGQFPSPVGSPSGSQVWEWSAVRTWLKANLSIVEGLELPSSADYSCIDTWILHHVRSGRQTRVTPSEAAPGWHVFESSGEYTMAPVVQPMIVRESVWTRSETPETAADESQLELAG